LRIFLVLALVFGVTAAASAREPLDIEVFTKIGPPGQPEPVVIGPDRRVYVGTNQLGHGDADAPSKVFAFSTKAKLVREYELEGQPLDEDHGIQGLAFDRDGLLYALDRSADPRVVRLDPATGRQKVYARFRDVPPCGGEPDGNCSATQLDNPAGPDYAVFAPNGDLYVTDIDQALIWRVPEGGGRPEVWLTDPRFESLYGPNGIQFMADGRTLLFVNTASNPNAGNSLTGRLYTVPVQPDGTPGDLTQVWESLPLDAPDGIAIARSGNVYVVLAGASQVLLLSPEFTELARTPPNPMANEQEEIPMDSPGSAAFLGDRLLVSNHSAIRGDPDSWAILDVFADEPGLPLHYPRIVRPELRMVTRWTRGGRRVRVRVRRTLASRVVPVRGARVRALGIRARTNKRGRATLVLPREPTHNFTVRARKRGFKAAKVKIAVTPV
jgi:sugar lactone lactonase YvrE